MSVRALKQHSFKLLTYFLALIRWRGTDHNRKSAPRSSDSLRMGDSLIE